MLDRVFPVERLVHPQGRALLAPEAVDQNPVLAPVLVTVRNDRAGGVPKLNVGRRPREVPHGVGGETIGESAVRGRHGHPIRLPIGAAGHVDHRVSHGGGRELAAGLIAPHLLGVRERARSHDGPSGRDRQAHAVVAEVVVELGRTQIGLGVPPPEIVINRHPRIPVADEVHLTIAPAHPSGVALGKGLVPFDGEGGGGSRRDRTRRPHPKQGRAGGPAGGLSERALAGDLTVHAQAPEHHPPVISSGSFRTVPSAWMFRWR